MTNKEYESRATENVAQHLRDVKLKAIEEAMYLVAGRKEQLVTAEKRLADTIARDESSFLRD